MPSFSRRTRSVSAVRIRSSVGSVVLTPATASTKVGAVKPACAERGRNIQSPVSSIQVRTSSIVTAPCPFCRILSERAASNCSAVKDIPHFQAQPHALRASLTRGRKNQFCRLGDRRKAATCSETDSAPGLAFLPGNFAPIGVVFATFHGSRSDGRPAGSLSKNTSKRLVCHADMRSDVQFLIILLTANPFFGILGAYLP